MQSSYVHFQFLTLSDYGVDKYDIGTAFGHFGVAVEDVSPYSILIYDFGIGLFLTGDLPGLNVCAPVVRLLRLWNL